MIGLQTLIRILLAMVVAMQLTACSRTVQWEEEVPLNTGETIVVKRSGTYTYGYSAASGYIGYSPEGPSTIEFSYKGKRYSHTGYPGLLLLAIAPDGLPNLAANPRNNEWHWKNNYYCVTPYYVQFKPSNGNDWTWPDRIEPWLYGLPTNIRLGLAPLEDNGKKYSKMESAQFNRSITGTFPEFASIDIKHTNSNTCPRRN